MVLFLPGFPWASSLLDFKIGTKPVTSAGAVIPVQTGIQNIQDVIGSPPPDKPIRGQASRGRLKQGFPTPKIRERYHRSSSLSDYRPRDGAGRGRVRLTLS